jgi:ABC-2 type transport system permease protein
MFNLIKADIYKLSKMNVVRISILASTVCALVVAFMLHGVYQGTYSLEASSAFALVSDTMIITILGSILIGTLICGSFESKNIHDEIACGYGRIAIVITKAISITLLVILLSLPYVLISVIGFASQVGFGVYVGIPSAFFNILSNVSGVEITGANIFKSIILGILITLSYIAKLSICIPVAFKSTKSIVVILTGFVTTFVFDIISALTKDIDGISSFIKYLPYSMTYNLTLDCSTKVMVQSMFSSILFTLFMLWITYKIFKKAEIK